MGIADDSRNFADFDFEAFWEDHPYSRDNYQEPSPSDATVAEIEAELGYRLPASYVALARVQNGGLTARSCFPMDEATSWADDHVAITGIYAIGRSARYSLCGEIGSPFMQREWGYPDIGVIVANTPSAGHDMIMLDYRACGPQGEPAVVHVDQEDDFRITPVAPDFESFIRGLVSEDAFDTSAEDLARAIDTVENGSLSPIVTAALARAGERLPQGEAVLRNLARRIVDQKGFFALHADADSQLMYGLMFWLYSQLATATSFEAYIAPPRGQAAYDPPTYEMMIAFCLVAEPYGMRTGGYGKGFVQDWWDAQVAAGALVQGPEGWRLTPEAQANLLAMLPAPADAAMQ